MIITTSKQAKGNKVQRAQYLADKWEVPFVIRKKASMKALLREWNQPVYVVENDTEKIYHPDEEHPFYFHPSMAWLRAKRLLNNERDTFVEAAGLQEGMSVLDCTMGLASDSIIASFSAGEKGKVTALEGNRYMAEAVTWGLKEWKSGNESFDEACQRINVVVSDHVTFLQKQQSDSFDIVYFDPMFHETIDASTHLHPLKKLAWYNDLTAEAVEEGKRVAKERVVLKDEVHSPRFHLHGFTPRKRKSSKIAFGTIEKKEGNT
ncbi:class I SAM-dependent methyltransferase [Thalassorhabdus alkalitolerans]|uniref:Class I SAM-dependent methyltransferase n=1 Tax=Thalassorhabdus alkalitolerans TaxID=2282697 RepID=A0ABW0YKN2_9BACI